MAYKQYKGVSRSTSGSSYLDSFSGADSGKSKNSANTYNVNTKKWGKPSVTHFDDSNRDGVDAINSWRPKGYSAGQKQSPNSNINGNNYSFMNNNTYGSAKKANGGNAGSTEEQDLYAYPDLSGFYQARLDSILNNLQTQRDNAIKGYEAQKAPIAEQYQDLRNQSEVERYKAEGKLRNALADRGALDSGAGRTEQLNLQTNYGNTLGKINRQEQSALDDINRAISDVKAQYAQQEAEAKANMYNDVTDWLIGITPMSVNLQPYLERANGAINDGALANVGSNVGSNLNTGLSQLAGLNFLMNGNTGLDTNNAYINNDNYRLLRNALSNRVLSPFGV